MVELDYRLLLDAQAEAVLAVDSSHRIVYANRAAERLLGWPVAELLDQPLTTIIPTRFQSAHREGFKRFMATREPRVMGTPLRVAARRRDGGEVRIDLNLADAGGGVVVATLHDAGQRLQLERQQVVERYLRATSRAAARLGSRMDIGALLETVVETLVADFDSASARLWLLDESAASLILHASAGSAPGSPPAEAAARPSIDLHSSAYKLSEVARRREPVVSNSLLGDNDFDQDWVARERLTGMAAFPLMVGGNLVGVLASFMREPVDEDVVAALSAIVGIISSAFHDILTFEKARAAQAEAEEQRKRLETVLDALPVGVMLVEGREGRLTLMNPAVRAMAGDRGSPEAVATFLSAIPLCYLDGRPVPLDQRPLARTLEQGVTVQERLKYRRPDGGEVIVDVSTAPFPGGGAVSTFYDVTDRVALESEAARAAAQLKALLDHLPVGVAYFDERGICRAANVPARRTMSFSRSEISGTPGEELFARAPSVYEALATCLRERTHQEQHGIAWADPVGTDELRYLDWRFEPLTTDSSRPAGVLALVIDETNRKRAEEQLRRAKDDAERASKNKTQFLSAVSHDLRTPVNALSLQAELLAQILDAGDADEEELTLLADEMQQAARNLVELINDLLDLTRFESGAMEYHPSDFPLDEWLVSTLSPLELTARAKGLDFRWKVDQAGRVLHADRVKLGRVLVNLAGNAVKFTERGEVEVSARATSDGWLAISVRDTGPGIPDDQQGRIFDEFAQLRNPERDRTKGTGLGLAICRRLVDSSGGRLTVESRVGRGSRFTAYYPPNHISEVSLEEPEVETREWVSRDHLSSISVLLVEDDPYSRKSLTRLLSHAGYTVEAVGSGPEALAALNQSLPAVVLLDLMLPGMDGVEVLREIRRNYTRNDLPVIILSGDVLGGRSGQLKALDVNGLLAKPVDFEELRTILVRLAGGRSLKG